MSEKTTSYERVQAARSGKRPMGGYYINNMLDSFIELHGDRRFGDDGAIVGGIGYLDGVPVTAIAMERGDTLEERIKRHFGCPTPEGYRKALRLMSIVLSKRINTQSYTFTRTQKKLYGLLKKGAKHGSIIQTHFTSKLLQSEIF